MAYTTVDCLPPITGREKLGRALLLIPLGNTFGFRQLREQRLEKCGLCPINLHFSRPLIGGRQATVVQWELDIGYLKIDPKILINKSSTNRLCHNVNIHLRIIVNRYLRFSSASLSFISRDLFCLLPCIDILRSRFIMYIHN